ncbi:MAG: hypothetical protein V3U29_04880, partial [Phycisphaeraceae bacterium]
DRLEDAGFEHYEISNWARLPKSAIRKSQSEISARRCQHNMVYWTNQNWLGVGPGAASHVDGHRWKNEPHLGRYIAAAPTPPTVDHETLPQERRIGERLMLALRLRQGVAFDWLNANLDTDDPRWSTFDELINLGMLERTETHLRLTRKGLFVADSIIGRLL